MSKPKCDWCVWVWHVDKYTGWNKVATFHQTKWGQSGRDSAQRYADYRYADFIRVLPAGREPKGRP